MTKLTLRNLADLANKTGGDKITLSDAANKISSTNYNAQLTALQLYSDLCTIFKKASGKFQIMNNYIVEYNNQTIRAIAPN